MYHFHRSWLHLAAVIIPLICFAGSAHAYTMVLGTPDPGSASGLPLGTGNGQGDFYSYTGEFQQVFSSTEFTGPITIDSISFISDNDQFSTYGEFSDTFSLALSSTSADPDNLSTTYGDNVTSTETQVFDGTINADLEGTGNPDFVIPISPYTYDPSTGNLLMDFNITGSNGPSGGNGNGTVFFEAQNPAVSGIGTVYTFEDGTPEDTTTYNNTAGGLVTSLDIVPKIPATPEPSPLAVFVLGFVMLAGFSVSKKKPAPCASERTR